VPTNMTFSRRSFILMSLSLAACKGGADIVELSGSTMGTTYSVSGVDLERKIDKAALHQAIEKKLLDINTQMSNWDAGSEVSRFNALKSTAAVNVSEGLAKVVSASKDVHLASQGQFDITLGPVIEAWGFGAKKVAQQDAPFSDTMLSALGGTNQMQGLKVEGATLRKSHPDTQIYLPSVGKGYGVDQIASVVREFGITDFMVEIGGDLYVSGRNAENTKWQIGIETPDAHTRQAYKIASVSDLGMATSGDYRNYFERDGKRFSHIIDADTGRPITHRTASATVLAENTMLADAWSTAMLALGTERGLEIANRLDLAVLFIDRSAAESDNGFVSLASKRFAAMQA